MKRVLVAVMLTMAVSCVFAQESNPMQDIYRLFREEKFEEAMKLVDEQITEQGETAQLLQMKYYLHMAQDQIDEALSAALKREEIAERKSPWLCMDIVECYVRKEDKKETLKWLDTAVDRGFNSYVGLEDEKFAFIHKDKKFRNLLAKIKENVGIGKTAKDIQVHLLNGQPWTLSGQIGKVMLVDFWATWCGPCREEMPNLKELYAAYKDQGFDIIGVSLDNEESKLHEYIDTEEIGWNITYSGKGWKDDMAALYGVNSIPSYWLVDKKGILRHFGLRGEALKEAVEELLAE